MGEQKRAVKSIETMFQIVDSLIEHDGARVTELAQELDLAKSTVHRQLSTLCSLGYAVKEGEEYQVGLRFLEIGEYARYRPKVSEIAEPLVDQLANDTGERAQFIVEEHGRGVFLHVKEGERGVKADRHPGKLRYLHSGASGKAILAHMSKERVEEIIDQWGLPAETDNTITSKPELYRELEHARERGYATNKEESITGLWALGVPVVVDGEPVGAFSISGPRYRLETDWFNEELPNLLKGTANEMELKLEYS